ncbi:sensor histidine kinase [Polluticoccus soli]|uniref:sensor histidine kinase n=1 Tax=Polluticoccus soli TaxID=3034150 RepID=UPI0023E1933A|nr:histidine kinase [Flavipsychrobacter sp. JY13-12]
MIIGKPQILFGFLILFICSWRADGQINLNINNGMPSNHVYQMVRDKYGYLWIATTNGVVRYNGYELKTYTIADGLPSNDVWSIHLDKKDRLWLLCFAHAPGYIYKNKYHETYVDNDDYTLSTTRMAEHKDGVAFINKYRTTGHYFFRERNDSIASIFNDIHIWYFYLNQNAEFINGRDDSNFVIYTYKLAGDTLALKSKCTYDSSIISLHRLNYTRFNYHNYDIAYFPGKNNVYALNFATCKLDTLSFPGAVSKILHLDKYLCVLTRDSAYKLNEDLSIQQSTTIADLTNNFVSSPAELVYFVEDDLWGKTIATLSNGMFVLPPEMSPFKRLTPFLNARFKYIGMIDNGTGYWWNAHEGIMATIGENGTVENYRLQTRESINKVLPLNDTHSILFFNDAPRLINHKTKAIKNLSLYTLQHHTVAFRFSANNIVSSNGILYTASSSGFDKAYISNDTFYFKPLYSDRCIDVLYDSLRQMVWAYNTGKIILHNKAGNTFVITSEQTRALGINRIEQIVLDNKYGNIFIKDGDRLQCFNLNNYSCHQLFNQCNLSDTKIFKRGNVLVIVGKFGVLYSKIQGKGKLSAPIIHFNDKYNFYQSTYDVQVSKKEIFLNTNNGLYSINMPKDEDYDIYKYSHPFSLLLSYAGDLSTVNSNDSITIHQNDRKLLFDLINPLGNGHVKYQYMINGVDSTWLELNNNELNLPNLQPGQYHTLSLKVRDDVWKSNPMQLHLYVIPYWWQTNPGQSIVLLLGLALVTGVILSTVLITRKIIMKNNLRKNKLLELEIKSIHSQINPHFIFNTLNTTLHYIVKKKLDEAYDHVSSFSSLLRAYLKSSRNRYITLGEEINNLQNYIRLQQTRFENAFSYEIKTNLPDNKTIYVPSLLLQPIVENAINHGLLPKDAPGHLKLTFSANATTNVLQCMIDDDGVGRKKHITDKQRADSGRESYGNHLIKELVDILNKYENAGIEINYIDKELPETGTTVIITIKNALKDG